MARAQTNFTINLGVKGAESVDATIRNVEQQMLKMGVSFQETFTKIKKSSETVTVTIKTVEQVGNQTIETVKRVQRQISEMEKTAEQASSKMEDMAKTTVTANKRAGDSEKEHEGILHRLGESAKGVGESFKRMAEIGGGLILGAGFTEGVTSLGEFAKGTVAATENTQTFQTQLNTLYHNSTQAAAAMKFLDENVQKNPFPIEQVRASAASFIAMGADISKAVPAAENLAAAMHKPVDSTTQAMVLAMQGNFRGLRAQLHISTGELQEFGLKFDKAGHVIQSTVLPAIEKLTASKFGDAAAKQAENWAGASQRLRNVFDELQEKIGGIVLPYITKAISGLVSFVSGHIGDIERFTDSIAKGLSGALHSVTNALGGATGISKIFNTVVHDGTVVISSMWKEAVSLWTHLTPLVKTVSDIVGHLHLFSSSGKSADGVLSSLGKTIPFVVAGFISYKLALGAVHTATTVAQVAAGAYKGVQTAITAATKLWSIAQVGLNLVLSANPIAIVVLAVAGLIAAFVLAYTHIKGFHDLVNKVWSFLSANFLPTLKHIGEFLGTVFKAAWEVTSTVVKASWDKLSDLWSIVDQKVMPIIKTVAGFLIGAAKAAWDTISQAIQDDWHILQVLWTLFDQSVLPILKNVANFLGGAAKAAWDTVTDAVKSAWKGISDLWSLISDKVMPILKNLADTISGTLTSAWSTVSNKVKDFWDMLTKFSNWLDKTLGKALEGVGDNVKNFLGGAFDFVGDSVRGLIKHFEGLLKGLEKIPGIGGKIKDALKFLENMKDFVVHATTTVVHTVHHDIKRAENTVNRQDQAVQRVSPTVHHPPTTSGAEGRHRQDLLHRESVAHSNTDKFISYIASHPLEFKKDEFAHTQAEKNIEAIKHLEVVLGQKDTTGPFVQALNKAWGAAEQRHRGTTGEGGAVDLTPHDRGGGQQATKGTSSTYSGETTSQASQAIEHDFSLFRQKKISLDQFVSDTSRDIKKLGSIELKLGKTDTTQHEYDLVSQAVQAAQRAASHVATAAAKHTQHVAQQAAKHLNQAARQTIEAWISYWEGHLKTDEASKNYKSAQSDIQKLIDYRTQLFEKQGMKPEDAQRKAESSVAGMVTHLTDLETKHKKTRDTAAVHETNAYIAFWEGILSDDESKKHFKKAQEDIKQIIAYKTKLLEQQGYTPAEAKTIAAAKMEPAEAHLKVLEKTKGAKELGAIDLDKITLKTDLITLGTSTKDYNKLMKDAVGLKWEELHQHVAAAKVNYDYAESVKQITAHMKKGGTQDQTVKDAEYQFKTALLTLGTSTKDHSQLLKDANKIRQDEIKQHMDINKVNYEYAANVKKINEHMKKAATYTPRPQEANYGIYGGISGSGGTGGVGYGQVIASFGGASNDPSQAIISTLKEQLSYYKQKFQQDEKIISHLRGTENNTRATAQAIAHIHFPQFPNEAVQSKKSAIPRLRGSGGFHPV